MRLYQNSYNVSYEKKSKKIMLSYIYWTDSLILNNITKKHVLYFSHNLRTSFRPEWWYADTGALFLRIIYTLKSLLSVGWFRICTLNSDFRIGTYMNKSHNRIELCASLTRGDTRPASDVVKRIHKSASAKRELLLLLITTHAG